MALDFETKDTHMVMLTATDPSGANDHIMVTVTVTDENDNAVIAGSTAVDYDENDTARWPPSAPRTRTATTSSGPSAGLTSGDFTIDGGVLSFKKRPQLRGPEVGFDRHACGQERLQRDCARPPAASTTWS